MINVAALVIKQSNAEEVMVPMMKNENNNEERQEASSTTVNSTAPKCKRMSKKQEYQAKVNDCILQTAEKQEDQADLELAAVGAHIKTKLSKDEIDDILDEIKDLTRDFLNRKCHREEVAAVSVQQPISTAASTVLSSPTTTRERVSSTTRTAASSSSRGA